VLRHRCTRRLVRLPDLGAQGPPALAHLLSLGFNL
jgi:hypothetical protein